MPSLKKDGIAVSTCVSIFMVKIQTFHLTERCIIMVGKLKLIQLIFERFTILGIEANYKVDI